MVWRGKEGALPQDGRCRRRVVGSVPVLRPGNVCGGPRVNSRDYAQRRWSGLFRQRVGGAAEFIYRGKEKEDAPVYERKVHVVGGDFFSQSEYEKVKKVEDNVFARFQPKTRPRPEEHGDVSGLDFCTETLAQIYAEQGYFEQAKRIYGKLILAFPEKSAYFASLIGKLDNLINNQTL